ncbi:Sulfur carrier protein ThiS (thiamine biosynthesis) (ThiS) (PDB:1F0Z) [Commensalibacter communis]|uniref:Sulfur carrier protein ThiS (Thiamine biosynthesis) (ThiS) n=1 Tax=Commensalibacter communis TaxID=2972786 RepID=A0A9W4TMP1_9PROT|nr:sulfur carrier protein ThiS [Commensalibacter communis]CAI3936312.1 Sulfur carrier protein ThiS (thiamine biosynthesis) (ThiS) (PDB:1F0Z) [Commensalibacter communis]CAI3942682.1 Sulfur carrier protein ThiS (thiamine biosynthesis) (ThiS) (PDB:1F0Z) [Commensalibacter communis]CAI3942699.1 Sulfur carrier protein ThiS (thiamine biosynthesis) (ThiS) (PDB:1F0Z) [Commensalibacter communis]CAI3944017.1 Sulfur carrier protein ThiS (thiamine biosynthesis) (ThiS) (PDB:1F0Z) [Commensalibacter communis]
MNIYLNGNLLTTSAKTLSELLKEQNIDSTVVAAAMNGDFVPRHVYETTAVTEGSKIEILSPMQGG